MTLDFQIRQATIDDVPYIFKLIEALAEYEQLTHQVKETKEDLQQHLFGSRVYAEAIFFCARSE